MNSALSQQETPSNVFRYGYLPELVGHLLGLAHIQATNLCSHNLAELRITPKQAVSLYFVSKNSETMQKDLATGVGTSPTVMVGILDVLEKRGFLSRAHSKQDRRSQIVTLTAKGNAALPLVKEALFVTETQIDESSSLSTEERQQLLKLLRKLVKREPTL